jgi:hypothetical protein
VGDQVQQLRDFGLKGMGLFAHNGSTVKRSENKNAPQLGALWVNFKRSK